MESLEKTLQQTLKESPLGEGLLVRRIPKDWKTIVGEALASVCEVQRIEPPVLYVAVTNSVWMQELQMKRSSLVQKINDFYGKPIIADIRLRMQYRSFVKAPPRKMMEDWRHKRAPQIPLDQITLSLAEVSQIQERCRSIKDPKRRAVFVEVQERSLKKKKWLTQHGYYPCRHCGMLINSGHPLCVTCLTLYKRKRRTFLVHQLRLHPLWQYEACCEKYPCSKDEFKDAKRELIYQLMERIRMNGASMEDKKLLVILIRQRVDIVGDVEAVEAFCDKYRRSYVAKIIEEEKKDVKERESMYAHKHRS